MNHKRMIWRGDIYRVDFGQGRGSEQGGLRPAVIVQNNVGNWASPTVIVVPLTSRVFSKSVLPTHSLVTADSGVENTSLALTEQVRTVDKRRLHEYIGHLNQAHMNELDIALAVSVGLQKGHAQELRLSLCPSCAQKFYESSRYYIHRAYRYQTIKESCDLCRKYNSAYDYVIYHKPAPKARPMGKEVT